MTGNDCIIAADCCLHCCEKLEATNNNNCPGLRLCRRKEENVYRYIRIVSAFNVYFDADYYLMVLMLLQLFSCYLMFVCIHFAAFYFSNWCLLMLDVDVLGAADIHVFFSFLDAERNYPVL